MTQDSAQIVDKSRPQAVSPGRLAFQLAAYYSVLIGLLVALITIYPDSVRHLPFGGADALDNVEFESVEDLLQPGGTPRIGPAVVGTSGIFDAALFLMGHLVGTILVMIPVTFTYRAIMYEAGFTRNFLRALVVLPICATTVVLLIQNNLALAFGLAALVAAVRFRVALDEAIDGIFIFAAISVGLAAGIGYLGIAIVMSMIFCATILVLWVTDYGQNPHDDARRTKRRAKLDRNKNEQD